MKKGDQFEGIVETIEFPNKGIVTVEGERVVVKNALPGQKIQGVLTKKRKGKSEGQYGSECIECVLYRVFYSEVCGWKSKKRKYHRRASG